MTAPEQGDLLDVQPPPAPSGLPFGLSMDSLQRLAGISALASFVFVIAGTISSAAYLSAWSIPATLVRLDPLAALTKAGELVYTFILVGVIWAVLEASHARTKHHRGLLAAILVLVAAGLLVLAVDAALKGLFGATLAAVATYMLFLGARLFGRVPLWLTILVFVVVILVSAYLTGNELGERRRTMPEHQTRVMLTLRAPIAGLPGGVIDGPAYKYEDLYLIFQDDQFIYVGSNAALGTAFLVGIGQIVAVTVVGSP